VDQNDIVGQDGIPRPQTKLF